LYFEFCHPSKILHRNANIKLNKPPGINFRNENVMSVQLNKLKKNCSPLKGKSKHFGTYTGCPRTASPEKKGSVWVNVII
jgi:hypothetical protein